MFGGTAFTFFRTLTALFILYLTENMFWVLATTVEAASLSSKKTAIRLFVAKYAALTFIATRICFGLLATKLGFFEAYITKNSVVAFC